MSGFTDSDATGSSGRPGDYGDIIIESDGDYSLAENAALNWRRNPTAVTDSGSEAVAILAAMSAGSNSPSLKISPSTTRTLVFDIPRFSEDGVLVFEIDSDTDITWTIAYSESFDGGSTYSTVVNPTLVQVNNSSGFRLQKQAISKGPARKARITFAHNITAGASDVGFRYVNALAFFEYMEANQHDYVVCLGASITEITVRHRDWQSWWKKAFNRDPVVFNEAISGYTASQLASAISAIIARHPKAHYYVLEIGGNDVSTNRPYSGASQSTLDAFRSSIVSIISACTATGAKCYLSRVSYRNYTAAPAVSGTTNENFGSKPFNEGVVDKVIEQYTGDAFDGASGHIDPYTFLRNNYHLIDLDIDSLGIHPGWYGGYRYSKYMAHAVGGVIYRGKPLTIPNESTTTGITGAKEDVIISFGVAKTTTDIYLPSVTGQLDSFEGVTYNQLVGTSTTTGDVTTLKNVDGEACVLGIDMITAFSGANNVNAINTVDSPFRAQAKTAFAFQTAGSGAAVFNITGCSTSATYRIDAFGSRDGSGSRLTRYRQGATQQTLDVINNVSAVASFTGVVASAGGISFSTEADVSSAASFAYLNAVRIRRE